MSEPSDANQFSAELREIIERYNAALRAAAGSDTKLGAC